MTEEEVLAILESEMTEAVSSDIPDALYSRIVVKVQAETGWSLPVTGNFRVYWFIERAKRHLFFVLLTMSSPDFKYKQISLDQPFEHYKKIVDMMDAEWAAAKAENEDQFPVELTDDSYKMFCALLTPGFIYDALGQDVTPLLVESASISYPTSEENGDG